MPAAGSRRRPGGRSTPAPMRLSALHGARRGTGSPAAWSRAGMVNSSAKTVLKGSRRRPVAHRLGAEVDAVAKHMQAQVAKVEVAPQPGAQRQQRAHDQQSDGGPRGEDLHDAQRGGQLPDRDRHGGERDTCAGVPIIQKTTRAMGGMGTCAQVRGFRREGNARGGAGARRRCVSFRVRLVLGPCCREGGNRRRRHRW